jgi:3-deoxy-D-manno-octulosonic-acid transferase
MLMFLYDFVWTLLFIQLLPLAAAHKRRAHFFERLSLKLPKPVLKEGTLWVHALSVGEVMSAIPLVKALKAQFPAKGIVMSASTHQGMAVARDHLKGQVDGLFYMPFDFWWSTHRLVKAVKPALFILVETDIWPGFLDYLSSRHIKAILVNGRISPRTFRSYSRFSFFVRRMFHPLHVCLMQSDLDARRLSQIGVKDEKILTTGNIKFDRHWLPVTPKERQEWLDLLGLKEGDLVWVAGSTHRGEEQMVLEVFKRLRFSYPLLRLVVAPRRVALSVHTRDLAKGMGFKAVLRTGLPNSHGTYDVLVLDTLGELDRVYSLGEVSFVGGSLVPLGGHNLLEPAAFGRPVIFGPHTHNFAEMSETLLEAGGGWKVQDQEGLYEALKRLLGDSELRKRIGENAKAFVDKNRGALRRVQDCVEVLLDGKERSL